MRLNVMLKNGEILTYNNVFRVANQSARFDNDNLLIYRHCDLNDRPLIIPTKDVICAEAIEN